MPARLGHGSRPGDDGEEGHADRSLRRAPAHRRESRSLGRQLRADELRRRRGDGRTRPRRARLRLREEIRLAHQAGDLGARPELQPRCVAGVVRRQAAWRLRQFRQVRRPRLRSGHRRDRRRPRGQGPRREESAVPPARLGDFPPALLGLPDPDHPLRQLRLGAGARRPTARHPSRGLRARRRRQSAGQARRFPQLQLPQVWQARPARDRHDGHLRRFVVVLRALRRRCRDTREERQDGRRRHTVLDAGRPVHRRHRARDPAPALFALLDQGDARRRAGQAGRARGTICESPDAGHGAQPHLQPAHRQGRHRVLRARGSRSRARRVRTRDRRHAQGRRFAGRLRRRRHHVEVETQRRRSAGADRNLRRRHRALLHDVRESAGADPRMVGLGRRGRLPLLEARLVFRPCAEVASVDGRGWRTAAGNPLAAQAGQLRPRQAAAQHRRIKLHEDVERLGKGARRPACARVFRHPAARALPDRPAHRPCAVDRAGLRPRHPAGRLARAARRSAGAGRGRACAAGQRQAARQSQGQSRR